MPRIISFVSRKGGVGKTTSTVTIAARLADLGFKTCIVDFDTTQSNATSSLIGHIWNREIKLKGICSVIADGGKLDEIITETNRDNLYIIPSEKVDNRGRDYNLEATLTQYGADAFFILKDLINDSDLLKEMHFVLIDNAPHLGSTVVASLVASDYFVIPVQVEDLSIDSIVDTVKAGLKVKSRMNKMIEPLGFFVSSLDRRPKLARVAIGELEELSDQTGLHFFETQIPVSSKFGFLPRKQETIFEAVKSNERGHREYIMLTDEILERIKEVEKAEQAGNLRQVEV